MVFAQTVPQDTDMQVIQAISKEHKDTRKFVSDELTRQREELFKEVEKQAIYYENEIQSFLREAVFKLGLLWGGIVMFVVGVTHYLSRKLDKRKWNKMLDSAKEELRAEMMQRKPEPSPQQIRQTYDIQERVKRQQEELKNFMQKDSVTGVV